MLEKISFFLTPTSPSRPGGLSVPFAAATGTAVASLLSCCAFALVHLEIGAATALPSVGPAIGGAYGRRRTCGRLPLSGGLHVRRVKRSKATPSWTSPPRFARRGSSSAMSARARCARWPRRSGLDAIRVR